MDGAKYLKIGSHLKMKNGEKIEIIPIHAKDMPIGTANAILKRTGLKQ